MSAPIKLADKNKDFFKQVHQVAQLIPAGRVTSYGAIANYLGSPRGARMVGWAMAASHGLEDVPAHRVVNRNGLLSGKHHFSNPEAMQKALEKEGLQVEEDIIQDFQNHFWDPTKELSI